MRSQPQAKLIRVLAGAVLDVAADIRAARRRPLRRRGRQTALHPGRLRPQLMHPHPERDDRLQGECLL